MTTPSPTLPSMEVSVIVRSDSVSTPVPPTPEVPLSWIHELFSRVVPPVLSIEMPFSLFCAARRWSMVPSLPKD